MYSLLVLGEQRRIVACLDGLPPIGDLRQVKVNALPAHAFGRLQSTSGEELSPSLRFGDCRCFARRSQSALMPSMYRGEHMKLFQLSLTLGLLSNIVLGALTRSWSPLVEMSPGVQKLATILLLILLAGIGTVLGVMSKNRKEVKAWLSIGVIGLNMLMLFTGIFLLFAG